MKHAYLRNSALALLFACLCGGAAAQTVYRITDLGDLPGNFGSRGRAINEAGTVVGFSFGSPGNEAFIWDAAGGLRDIGNLVGAQAIVAQDINDAGWITGATSGGLDAAFLLTDEAAPMQNLGLVGNFLDANANAINNANQIVGNLFSGPFAFIWDPVGGMQQLLDTQGSLVLRTANDINTSGVIVGLGDPEAYILVPGAPAVELGLLDATDLSSTALAINDLNQVVGESRSGPATARAFRWEAGSPLQDLGALDPSHNLIQAVAINNAGQIVGSSSGMTSGAAFLYTAADGLQDLNDLIDPTDPLALAVNLQQGIDINESGQIVADGLNNGLARTFLLTPMSPGPPADSVVFRFTGPLIDVVDPIGTATYSGALVDDILSGSFIIGETSNGSTFFPPATYAFPSSQFFGTITDGSLETSTANSARPMEVSFEDDLVSTADDIALVNDILGTNLPAGTPFDVLQLETDITNGNRRLEIGVSFVSLDTSYITNADYLPLPALDEVDFAVYFIVEEDNDDDLFEATGLLSALSVVPADQDTDVDGVPDFEDNCTLVSNGPLTPNIGANSQRDTNGDGYGNICDADLNDDDIVNPIDLGIFRSVFLTNDPDADFNGDGVVNPTDLGVFRILFLSPPGPSGLVP